MARRSGFGDLLEPGLRKIFFDNYNQVPQIYKSVFNVLTSTKQDETDSGVSGFGIFNEQSEGGSLTYEDPIQLYDVSYVHKKYSKGFKVTEELYEDDQYNVINRMPKNLGTAANRTVETVAADILNNSRVTTYTTGGDGKALVATDHPRADGGTAISNSDTYALDEASLKTAKLAMRATLDDKGQLIAVNPNKLIIPPALEDTANVLLNSTGRPYDGTTIYRNDVNVNKGKFEIIVWDYLSAAAGGSDAYWYLMDSNLQELTFFWRKALTFEQDESFNTDESLYKAKMRFSAGFSNWRGFYGSTGAS